MRIGILGSTGSIGCNALKVVKNLRNYNFPVDVIFLTTNSNIELFYHQVIEFKPKYVFISDKQEAKIFIEKYKITDTEIFTMI